MAKSKKRSTRRYRSPIQSVFRSAARILLLKPAVWSVLSVHVHGRSNLKDLPGDKAFIVTPNHSSHFDAPLIVGALPNRLSKRVAIGAAADYFFKNWYKALPTRAFLNTFPIDRDKSGKHKGIANELLSKGTPLFILPEGTRSRTGAMNEFKPGAAVMAIRHQIPIIPVALVGAHEAWPPGAKAWKAGRPPVHVNFGKPLYPENDESVEDFNERLYKEVSKLYDAIATAHSMPTQDEIKKKVRKNS